MRGPGGAAGPRPCCWGTSGGGGKPGGGAQLVVGRSWFWGTAGSGVHLVMGHTWELLRVGFAAPQMSAQLLAARGGEGWQGFILPGMGCWA